MFIDQGTYYSAGYTSIGGDPYGNYRQGQDTGQLTVALNKVIGDHEMKFGFEGRQHQMNYIQTNAPNGIFNFDHFGTSQCPNDFADCGGDGMAAFMMGQMANDANGSTYYEIQDRPATEDRQYAWFVQENWKVEPQTDSEHRPALRRFDAQDRSFQPAELAGPERAVSARVPGLDPAWRRSLRQFQTAQNCE